MINIFSQTEILFESSNINIKRIRSGLSYKLSKIFPLLKLNFYKNIFRINSHYFDNLKQSKSRLKKKYISFLETPLNHPDRILRDGKITKSNELKYYSDLNNFLKKISIILIKKL